MAVRLMLVRSVWKKKYENKHVQLSTQVMMVDGKWVFLFHFGMICNFSLLRFLGRSLYPIWKGKNFNQQFQGLVLVYFTQLTRHTQLTWPHDFRNSIGSNFRGVNHNIWETLILNSQPVKKNGCKANWPCLLLLKQLSNFLEKTEKTILVDPSSFSWKSDGFPLSHRIHEWYIYLHENHKKQPNVGKYGKYSIHGSYGYRLPFIFLPFLTPCKTPPKSTSATARKPESCQTTKFRSVASAGGSFVWTKTQKSVGLLSHIIFFCVVVFCWITPHNFTTTSPSVFLLQVCFLC